MARPKIEIELTPDERADLESLARRSRSNRHVALRAKLILASATGLSDLDVAAKYRVNNKTVGAWRKRFAERRLEGLYDEPRVGRPREISDEQVEAIVVQTLETTPKGRTHWSTRKMAAKAGIELYRVCRRLQTLRDDDHGNDTKQVFV